MSIKVTRHPVAADQYFTISDVIVGADRAGHGRPFLHHVDRLLGAWQGASISSARATAALICQKGGKRERGSGSCLVLGLGKRLT